MKNTFFVLLFTIIVNCIPYDLKAQLNQDFEKIDDAVIIVMLYDYQGDFIGHGSGFFIDSMGTFITNYHVIDGAYSVKVKFDSSGVKTDYDVDNIIKGDAVKDLAIISIKNTNGKVFPYLKIAKKMPSKGEECWAIGTPADPKYMNTISKGLISNISLDASTKILQTNAQISHGSSGGALINSKGEVVGVTSAGDGTEDGARASINFAIWIGELKNLPTLNKKSIVDPSSIPCQISFYTTDPNVGNVYLYIDGIYIGGFSKYFSKDYPPSCGDNGTVTRFLKAGSHSYQVYYANTSKWYSGYVYLKGGDCQLFRFENFTFIENPSFNVKLITKNYKNGIAYFCYRMGEKLNVEDSAAMETNGTAVFIGKRRLPGGIYTIVFPGKNISADFFIDKEQEISIEADTADLLNMKINGSPENLLFNQYQKFVGEKGSLLQKERNAYTKATNKKDSLLHEENYMKYNKELSDYRESILSNQPESMMAVMLKAMKEPEIPIKNAKTRQDTIYNYHYFKKHYWDGITFMDERVIRTPFFMPRLERYYRDIYPQIADSLIQDIDYKLLLARTCPEMYKFLLNWFTDEYLNPKIMGLDAVFVHLFEKYHSKGLSSWLNEKQIETISRRAYMQMSNLIGVTAANLEMTDSTGRPAELYNLAADYTLVVFWDPTCGHCKEEIPKIDSIYQASWKKKNVKIYAVLTEPDKKSEWINYIKEHKLGDWTHAYQTKEKEKSITDSGRASFRQLYDVISTPSLFLLDKDKRIIGKKLGWEQLNDFLQTKWKEKKG